VKKLQTSEVVFDNVKVFFFSSVLVHTMCKRMALIHKGKVKGEFSPILKHHVTKNWKQRVLRVLDLGSRERWVVSFTFRL